ncbi:TPA: Jag N-terminal domain-containing protein, partial [Campylobacter jejuni]
HGRGQTKPLDGVLIKIALEQLRAEFPDKYVGIKQNNDQRFVVINDFFKKDE